VSDRVRERIAENNRTFRSANEKIRARAHELDAPLELIPFLCECPTPACTGIVRLTLADYGEIRANPTHFLTLPGHEAAEEPLGQVVSRRDGYVVVEKDLEKR
jgi:hypothetical protein